MSTHDYVIDNQTAPNFRADLNNALLAIVSNNSSATAPAVTYANMTWYDTATNILYMRNEDNDAWIALGTLNQSTNTFTPAGSLTLASQAEAEAGTDNTKVMTPLRVEQAIVDRFNVSGSAPTYACRAWVRCSALGSVFASGNVSSVSRTGTGQYVITFQTAMQDINYSVTGTSQQGNDASTFGASIGVSGRSTSSFQINTRRTTNHDSFNSGFDLAIFR